MKIIQDFTFRQSGRKFPLSICSHQIGVHASAGISYRHAVYVMEPDPDTALKKSWTLVEAGLEADCSFRGDCFVFEVRRERIEVQAQGERAKGLVGTRRGQTGLRRWDATSQSAEIVCCLAIGYFLQASHQIDDITAGVASGEAVPEIFRHANHEGMGVVAVMDGTGADEPIALFGECFGKAPVRQHGGNGNGLFQVLKLQVIRYHGAQRLRFSEIPILLEFA